ncbi:unnamed protein product [Clonostachys rhizophaga]|uniref:Leucine-rich repeat domain-containing protein n=1 Tax=Clonostachys rhizophaga TaxID=160324 RepID=A0A9N9V3T1_9HYPO|nr:unnamed protein product [Clonostachys rhizophaga]
MEQLKSLESNSRNLLTLPPEIQAKIFSHLAASFGSSSIQPVLRTCKTLYEVALPISVSVFRNTVHSSKGHGPCSRIRNAQFLRYILVSKPWLAKHVNTVIFGRIANGSGEERREYMEDGKPDPRMPTDEELVVYRQHIELVLGQLPSDYTKGWYNHWVKDLEKGTSDAQISLILLACPNIRTIMFEMSKHKSHFPRLLNLIRNLVDINTSIHTPGSEWGDGNHPDMVIPLSNVQDVFHETVNYVDGYSEFEMDGPDLFALPRLRFYECILARGNDTAERRFGDLLRRSTSVSSVEDITLHCSAFTPGALKKMLRCCKALKKFEFTHHGYNISSLVMPRDILDAILPHADTLEELYINLEEDWDKGWNWHDCPGRLYMGTKLREMRVLKKLTVGMQALTGMLGAKPENHVSVARQMPLQVEGAPRLVDCLPENLEYLKVHACGLGIVSQVADLISAVEEDSSFKKLTYISLLFNGWSTGKEVDESQVRLICNAPGVHLDIGFQDKRRAIYDLGRDIVDGDGREPRACNLTSRIHAQDFRQYYLETRGTSEIPWYPKNTGSVQE